jgi:hypothetical protein
LYILDREGRGELAYRSMREIREIRLTMVQM